MPRQDAPPSRVRTIEVQGGCPHGALPNTQPSSVLTNVAEYGTNPLGTGPPAGPAGADADVVAGGSAPFADVAVGAVAAGAEDAPDDAPEGGGADAGGAEHADTSTQHRPTATKQNLATPPRTTPPPSLRPGRLRPPPVHHHTPDHDAPRRPRPAPRDDPLIGHRRHFPEVPAPENAR